MMNAENIVVAKIVRISMTGIKKLKRFESARIFQTKPKLFLNLD